MLMCQLYDRAQIRTNAVIRRIIHKHRLSIWIFLDRPAHIFHTHSKRNPQSLITRRIHIDRNRASKHHGAHDAAVDISRQYNLLAPLDCRQHHALNRRCRTADHQECVCRPECLSRQLLRIRDDGHRMAEVIERLHGIDVQPHAGLS